MFARKLLFNLVAVCTVLALTGTLMASKARPPKKPTNVVPGDYTSAIDYTDRTVRWAMKRYHLPSFAVILIDDQDTIWQHTVGLANVEEGVEADAATVYKLWSVAKVLTAVETLRLVTDGEIDLDAPITDYLPNVSVQSRYSESNPITARSLLTHRSGLPRNECHWIEMGAAALAEIVASVNDCQQAFPVGARQKYSNLGFDLLGYLIQEKRGTGFPEHMRENLLLPVGMAHSAFLQAGLAPDAEIALGYEFYEGEQVPIEQRDITSTPSGNLYSTIEDMGLFAKFILRNTEVDGTPILSRETFAEMIAAQTASEADPHQMGLGWKLAHLGDSEPVVWHDGGSSDGIGSLIALMPTRKLGVVMIANGTAFEGNASAPIALDILQVLMASKDGATLPEEETPRPIEPDRGQLESFAGKYAALGQVLEVYLRGDRLKGRIQGITFDLVPVGDTTFRLKHWLVDLGLAPLFQVPVGLDKLELEFQAGNLARADALTVSVGDEYSEICPRYPDLVEMPAAWAHLIGEYDAVARLPFGEVGPAAIGRASIWFQDGILQMSGVYGPLLPISDHELVIQTGPFAGEIMVVRPAAGSITHQDRVFMKR